MKYKVVQHGKRFRVVLVKENSLGGETIVEALEAFSNKRLAEKRIKELLSERKRAGREALS